jgi:hypothetical protein
MNNLNNAVFIKNNIPSLKNSKIATSKGVFHSKTVANFLREHGIKHYSSSKKIVEGYKTKPDTFRPYVVQLKKIMVEKNLQPPYKLEFYFARKTKARFDFGNAVELLSDLFTAYCLWEDDNCDYYLPFPWVIDNSCYKVDKDNPGVYIRFKED